MDWKLLNSIIRFPDCIGVSYHKSLRLVKFVLWFKSMKFIYIVVEIVKG